ncbi:hypothetical protein HHI36_016097, partial [Cryptolaemus montrouzieri]
MGVVADNNGRADYSDDFQQLSLEKSGVFAQLIERGKVRLLPLQSDGVRVIGVVSAVQGEPPGAAVLSATREADFAVLLCPHIPPASPGGIFTKIARRRAMEEVLPEGKNFKLLQDSELPEVLDFLSDFLPDSIKFHQTLKTFLNDRVWDFHFYVNKDWPERAVILHFPGMTKT